MSKIRKPGTGHISQISANLWEGRYSPKANGKRIARNIYAHSPKGCEEKLAGLIIQMKSEMAVNEYLYYVKKDMARLGGITDWFEI